MGELKKNLTFKRNKRTKQQIDDFIKTRFKNAIVGNLILNDDYFSFTIYSSLPYESLVSKLVREKYSADDEYKLHREAFVNGIGVEFNEYNEYVEDCKVRANAFIEEREKTLNV